MNWKRVLGNIGGVALACAGAHQVTAPAGAATDGTTLAVGIALCVAANLFGLFQHPPNQGG